MTSDDLYFLQVPVGEMQNLAYAIGSRSTREALLVDPAWSVDALLDRVEADGLQVVGALATHYHQDHVGGSIFGMSIEGLDRLQARQPVPVHVQAREAEGVRRVTGLSASDLVAHEGGDVIELGAVRVRLLHTPGHTPGSQCFRIRNHLVSGDTLFIQGCGRVDLPGSDPDQMYWSLRKLASLPDDTVVLPGHDYGGGASQPLGTVRRVNPYLRIESLDLWHQTMGH